MIKCGIARVHSDLCGTITLQTAYMATTSPFSRLFLRMQETPGQKLLWTATAWRILATVGSQLIRLVTAVLLARLLGRYAFGQFALLQNTVGLLGSMAGLGIGATVTKHVAEYRDRETEKAGRALGFGLVTIGVSATVVAAGLLFFAAPIAERALNSASLVGALEILSLDVILSSLDSVQVGALLGLHAFRIAALNANAKNVVYLVASITGAAVAGLNGAVWGQLLTDLLFLAINHLSLTRMCSKFEIKIKYSVQASQFRNLKDYSLPLFMSSMLNWFAQWFSNATLGRQHNGFNEFALVQVGRQWANIVTVVPGAMGEAGLPMLATHYGRGEFDDLSAIARRQHHHVFVLSGVAGLGLAIFSPLILLAYGRGFEGHPWPMVLISASAVLQALTNVPLQIVASTGRVWPGFLFTLGFSAVLITSTLQLKSFGATGLSFSYLLAYGVDLALLMTFSRRVLKQLRSTTKEELHA